MYFGSCLCGEIKFKLLSEPYKVSHCHCNMCQKQHGAAFATYATLAKSDLVYISGLSALAEYNSSANIKRKFCRICGSSIEWSKSQHHPSSVSVAIATFDSPYQPGTIVDIQTDTKVCWLTNT